MSTGSFLKSSVMFKITQNKTKQAADPQHWELGNV